MWVNEDEPAGSPITIGPAMAVTLGVALLGTIILGVYPQALFEYAEAAARTLGGVSSSVALQ